MYCRYCGSENMEDAIYCQKCGKKLKEPERHLHFWEREYTTAEKIVNFLIVIALIYLGVRALGWLMMLSGQG